MTRTDDETDEDSGWICSKWIASWSSTAAFVCLGGVNIFLFLQLQAVTYQVGRNTFELQHLHEELEKETTKTNQISHQVDHSLSQQMAGGFVLLTILITTFHVTAHLRAFEQPNVQRKIVAILFLPPIYGACSFVSLATPAAEEYMMIIKDFYEAYCIYQFLSFLIAVLGRGSREAVVKVLEQHSDHMPAAFGCWRGWLGDGAASSTPKTKSRAVLLECQILAMQFVFVKPLTAIAKFILLILQESSEDDTSTTDDTTPETYSSAVVKILLTPTYWILVIQNISVALAFCGLLKFYHIVHDDLLWCQPFSKFLCIKGVVFMTFWQGIAIAILLYILSSNKEKDLGEEGTSSKLQNLLICVEMLMFSLFHFCVFPVDEWSDGYRPKVMPKPGIALEDFVDDLHWVVGETAASSKSQGNRRRREVANNDSETPAETTSLL